MSTLRENHRIEARRELLRAARLQTGSFAAAVKNYLEGEQEEEDHRVSSSGSCTGCGARLTPHDRSSLPLCRFCNP